MRKGLIPAPLLLIVALVAFLILVFTPQPADASPQPGGYSVEADGIRLSAPLEDGGHVNIHATVAYDGDIHPEAKCVTRTDAECAGRGHDVAQLIGATFVPWSAFGSAVTLSTITWVQISGENCHYDTSSGATCKPTSSPSPTSTPSEPQPTSTPTSIPTSTPTDLPSPSATPSPVDTPVLPTPTTTSVMTLPPTGFSTCGPMEEVGPATAGEATTCVPADSPTPAPSLTEFGPAPSLTPPATPAPATARLAETGLNGAQTAVLISVFLAAVVFFAAILFARRRGLIR